MHRGLGKRILRGGIGSLVIKFGYIGLQFAIGVFLARSLEPSGLGIYAFVMALVQVIVIFAQFGFPAYLVHSVSVEKELGRTNTVFSLVSVAQKISLSLSVLFVLITIFSHCLFQTAINKVPNSAVYYGLLLIPPLTLSAVSGGVIRGMGHVVIGLLPDQILRPLGLLLALILMQLMGFHISPQYALLYHAVAAVLALIVAQFILRRILPDRLNASSSSIDLGSLALKSFPFLLLAGTQVLSQQTDVIMIGILVNQDAVGQFRVAAQVAEGMGVILFALSTTIAPEISRLGAKRNWQQLRQLVVNSHRAGVLLLLPFSVSVVIFSEPIVTSVFGEAYSKSASILTILAAGKVGYASVAFAGLTLSMIGYASTAAFIASATLLLNFGMNLVLVPAYGAEGAAIATVASSILVNAVGLMWIRYKLNLNFSAFSTRPAGDLK